MPGGRDLRSFRPRRDGGKARKNDAYEQVKRNATEDQMEQARRISEQMKQYEGKSEESMLKDVLKMTREQKEKGEWDSRRVEQMKNAIWPMLDEEQRKKLLSILGMIEEQ
jgi:hypothetical protein